MWLRIPTDADGDSQRMKVGNGELELMNPLNAVSDAATIDKKPNMLVHGAGRGGAGGMVGEWRFQVFVSNSLHPLLNDLAKF